MNGDCFSTEIILLTKNSKLSVLYPGKRGREWDRTAGNVAFVDVRTEKE